MREPIYDDFTGFTFNGKHCSQFGLVRVSDGDRYEDTLVLDHSNEAAYVPGGVGQYYWGEQIEERKFKVNIAYDSVTELEKREIKHWLHPDSKLHELIFDEKPYVKYWVKCTKEVVAKELCFNEEGKRVYKGEIDIEFTAFMPYGVDRWRYIPINYIEGNNIPDEYGNINEWYETSKLLPSSSYINLIDEVQNYNNDIQVSVYNPGDVETGFELILNKNEGARKITKATSTYTLSGYYAPISTNTIDINSNTFYVFIPQLSRITGTNNEAIIESIVDYEVIDNGYIDLSGNFPQFVSSVTGVKYDIYEFTKKSIVLPQFNIVGLDTYKKYSTIIDNEIYNFYVIPMPNRQVVCLDRNKAPQAINKDFSIFPDADVEIVFNLESNNCSFTLKIPNGASINPKDWTEAQKMLYYPSQLKIDTNKQLIQYREIINEAQDLYGPWIGVSGILKEGSLFKLPTNDRQILDILKITQQNTVFNFTTTKNSISYPYLYI